MQNLECILMMKMKTTEMRKITQMDVQICKDVFLIHQMLELGYQIPLH